MGGNHGAIGDAQDSAEALKGRLEFIPHYHVFPLDASSSSSDLCLVRDNQLYCAPDPDGPGPITGADVAAEDLRQLCLLKTTRKKDETLLGANYSREFWEYSVGLYSECPVRASWTRPDARFGEACSLALMKRLGIKIEPILECVQAQSVRLLDREMNNIAWSPQAVRINGWRYSGPLDPGMVLKAICSGYALRPPECDKLLSNQFYRFHWRDVGDSLVTLLITFGVAVAILLTLGWAHQNYLKKATIKVVKEEVQSQIADYVQLRDMPSARSLRF